MSKKIIVAGGGHGGIAAASLLSKAGFEVTVFEKNKRDEMGYDWTDSFDKRALEKAGLPMPSEDKFTPSTNITFVPPSERTLVSNLSQDEPNGIKMERRDIYDLIIENAEEAGVKFVFETNIEAPLLAGDRVVGIKTGDGDYYADLVIDACGCKSVIREQLPACCGIQKDTEHFEKFYAYRALYNKPEGAVAEHQYKVYLIPNGRMGIGWVIDDGDCSDLLIGEFEPFTVEEAQERLAFFKEHNPILGDTLLRGGIMTEIPVRQTLSIIVADGYAAIGDSAFMTIPLLGSGISNSFIAASILADVVIADKTQTYSAETLWEYQKRYFKEVGNGMAKLSLIRCILPRLTGEQVDYMFESEILTSEEMTISSGSLISLDAGLIKKVKAVVKDKNLVSIIGKVGTDMARLAAVNAQLPSEYSRYRVQAWAKKYDEIFKVKKDG